MKQRIFPILFLLFTLFNLQLLAQTYSFSRSLTIKGGMRKIISPNGSITFEDSYGAWYYKPGTPTSNAIIERYVYSVTLPTNLPEGANITNITIRYSTLSEGQGNSDFNMYYLPISGSQ